MGSDAQGELVVGEEHVARETHALNDRRSFGRVDILRECRADENDEK
jgi:hypothetical protein